VISKLLQRFSRTIEQFFLTVGQNNFGNKIPLKFTTTGITGLQPAQCSAAAAEGDHPVFNRGSRPQPPIQFSTSGFSQN
jgi:hypothetical protein